MLKTVPQDVLLSLPLVKRFLLMDEDKNAAINAQLLAEDDVDDDGDGKREPELTGLLVENDTLAEVDTVYDSSDAEH
jgi:hypothetical protein